jgi:hypothetical protein
MAGHPILAAGAYFTDSVASWEAIPFAAKDAGQAPSERGVSCLLGPDQIAMQTMRRNIAIKAGVLAIRAVADRAGKTIHR